MVVLLIIIAPILLAIFCFFMTALGPSDRGYANIDFESFRKFYNINPERWELHDDYVRCVTKFKYDIAWDYEQFQFNFVDYQKYKKWLNNKKQHDKDVADMKSTAKMIAAVKQDIEKIERISDEEINKAKSIIETLCEV